MEVSIKDPSDFNRLTNQITDMNMEIMLFLDKFTAFQKCSNIIDNNLARNLQNLVEHVECFLDGDPRELQSNNQTKIDINFKEQHLERSVICTICEIEIGNRFKDINRHLRDPFHKQELEFINTPPERRIAKPKIPIEETQPNKKVNEKSKLRAEKQNLPKKAKVFMCDKFENFINNAIREGNVIRNMPEYGKLEKSLLTTISSEFPNAKLHLFGSRISGLGTHDSDLDIFLDIGDVFNCYQENRDVILKKLRKVWNLLLKQRAEWKNILAIQDARVPIIRAYNSSFKIECDIGFSNGLGACNTRLIKYFCDLQPIFHKMGIFLKKWLDSIALSKQITTYTITLMIMFYLQSQELLPSVAILQSDVSNCLEIGPWMGNFAEKSLEELKIKLEPHDPNILKEHLKKFFLYYANLSYQNLIVCPYLGRIIERKNLCLLRKEMPRYFKHLSLDPKKNELQLDKLMCIQDPFELNHNTAKGVNDRLLILFRRFLLLSGQELKQTLLRN